MVNSTCIYNQVIRVICSVLYRERTKKKYRLVVWYNPTSRIQHVELYHTYTYAGVEHTVRRYVQRGVRSRSLPVSRLLRIMSDYRFSCDCQTTRRLVCEFACAQALTTLISCKQRQSYVSTCTLFMAHAFPQIPSSVWRHLWTFL